MSLHDVTNMFDRVAVLNLARRLDRWRAFLERLPSDWPFQPPLRFPAVDGHACAVPPFWKTGAGAWGCYQSHLAVIDDCLIDNIESVLIMEDDAIFVRDFSAAAREFLAHLPSDWQFIYFGGQHIEYHLGLPEKVNDWVYRPVNVNRLHAYALRGRAMLQRVHDHVQHPESWKPMHQIDHHLGELHKTMRTGLYAPRRWLVAQTEGQSDICEQQLPERMFWGAEMLNNPPVKARMVVVLGPYDRGTNIVAGLLHALGISMAVDAQASEAADQQQTYEQPWLRDMCQQMFEEPWLLERVNARLRAQLLRVWAAYRYDHQNHPSHLVGAKHPLLCLMGDELNAAWERPYLVAVDGDRDTILSSSSRRHRRWPLEAVMAGTDQLLLARDLFLQRYEGPQMRVALDTLAADPQATIDRLGAFLGVEFTDAQIESALSLVHGCGSDDP